MTATKTAEQLIREYRIEIADEFRRAIPTEAGAVLAALIEEGVTALESHIRYACVAAPDALRIAGAAGVLPDPDVAAQPAPVAAPSWQEVAQWLHAAYDRPPQTPEAKAMLARVDAAAAVPGNPQRDGETEGRAMANLLSHTAWGRVIFPGRENDDAMPGTPNEKKGGE